jgi:hypothetical protein
MAWITQGCIPALCMATKAGNFSTGPLKRIYALLKLWIRESGVGQVLY